VNQRMNASQELTTCPKSDGYGWVCGAHLHEVQRTPCSVDIADREATVNACGVTVAKPQGHSWAPHPLNGSGVNVGTTPAVPSPVSNQLVGGKTCRRLMLAGWDGGVVVVRGRESRLHGEGPQRVRSDRADRGDRR
jgi:hypothetical protein